LPAIRFAALGHLTNDSLSTGLVPGGSALYASLAARQLGADASIITSIGDDFVGRDVLSQAQVDVRARHATRTTTFENRYVDGHRRQRVLAVAEPLIDPVVDADVIFACPVIGEVDAQALHAPPNVLLGAGLQGWLRELNDAGLVSRRRLDTVEFLSRCDVLFMSDEDIGGQDDDDEADAFLSKLLRLAGTVVVTEGARGARVYWDGGVHRVHACPVTEVDPTGAGDVFAAAFLTARATGEPVLEAGMIAACAASFVVEDVGANALARSALASDARVDAAEEPVTALQKRLAWYRSNVAAPAEEMALASRVAGVRG
jgi:1D-myo-inositol 3-kinase